MDTAPILAWPARERPSALSEPAADDVIVDGDFGPIADPAALAVKLDGITGLLEHGIFVGMAEVAFVAHPDGRVQTLRP